MKNLLPKTDAFARIDLVGDASVDFGQRLFSRNITGLSKDSGVLSLFLSAEAKVLGLFWVFRTEGGLSLFTPERQYQELIGVIEKYHFAEAFTTQPGPTVSAYWENAQTGHLGKDAELRDGYGAKTAAGTFCGMWKNTCFTFELDAEKEEKEPLPETDLKWELHRLQNLIPRKPDDYDTNDLVFDIGFETLCEQAKGCYIGQEVVERVRSRGGSASRRLALVEWEKEPLPREVVMHPTEGQALGRTTSSFAQVDREKFLGFAYVRRGSEIGQMVVLQNGGISGRISRFIS